MRPAHHPENAVPRGFDLQSFIKSMEHVVEVRTPHAIGNDEACLYLRWLGGALRRWREHEHASVRGQLKNLLVQHLLCDGDLLEYERTLQDDPLFWAQVARAWNEVVADLSSNLETELRRAFEAQRDFPENELQELSIEVIRLKPEDLFTPTLVSSLQVERAAQQLTSRQRGEALMMCIIDAVLARWPQPPTRSDDGKPINAPKPKKGKKGSRGGRAGEGGSVQGGAGQPKGKSRCE